jgi:hypothetical protein
MYIESKHLGHAMHLNAFHFHTPIRFWTEENGIRRIKELLHMLLRHQFQIAIIKSLSFKLKYILNDLDCVLKNVHTDAFRCPTGWTIYRWDTSPDL